MSLSFFPIEQVNGVNNVPNYRPVSFRIQVVPSYAFRVAEAT